MAGRPQTPGVDELASLEWLQRLPKQLAALDLNPTAMAGSPTRWNTVRLPPSSPPPPPACNVKKLRGLCLVGPGPHGRRWSMGGMGG